MTRLTTTLLASIFLFACHSTDPKPASKPNAGPAPNVKQPDTVVPFAGFWLNETYVKNIELTRSPRKGQDASQNCCLFIPASTLQTASIADLHEGGPGMEIIKKDNSFQFYLKGDDIVSSRTYNIQVMSPNKLKVGEHTFIKTDEHFLADILFSGDYQDSLKNTVQFSKDGHLKGLGNYTVYEPIYDYMGPGMEVDLIDIGQNAQNMDQYGFKFSKDTLFIHNLNCLERDSSDNSCVEVSLGDVKYKLIRIH